MEKINPGGSLGDFQRIELKSLFDLTEFLKSFAGDLYTSNFFFLDKIKGLYVADLGCGYGYNTIAISSYLKGIDAFDVDKDAIFYASNKLKPLVGSSNCSFNVFNGYNTYKDNNSYDAVLSFEVLEHVPLPSLYLKEAQRILKKGGKLYMSTPNGLIANKNNCIIKYHSREHLTEYYPLEIENLLSDAGFEVDQFYTKLNKVSDVKRRPNKSFLRNFKIIIICKLKENKYSYIILKRIFKVFKKRYREPDSYLNYNFKKVNLEEITSQNCDVILVEAHKV